MFAPHFLCPLRRAPASPEGNNQRPCLFVGSTGGISKIYQISHNFSELTAERGFSHLVK
jgi:hypothetical protein